MLDLRGENLFDSTTFPQIGKKVAVNRSDLVDAAADAAGIPQRQAEAAVTAVIDAIIAEAKAGNRVTIFGFGTFNPTSRAARTGRNPQTGNEIEITARRVLTFKPSKGLKAQVNHR